MNSQQGTGWRKAPKEGERGRRVKRPFQKRKKEGFDGGASTASPGGQNRSLALGGRAHPKGTGSHGREKTRNRGRSYEHKKNANEGVGSKRPARVPARLALKRRQLPAAEETGNRQRRDGGTQRNQYIGCRLPDKMRARKKERGKRPRRNAAANRRHGGGL